MSEPKPNKPIALAVTLVILVLCTMLNIVFVSKNIGLNQEIQVIKGKTIITLLEKINGQSAFLTSQFAVYGEVMRKSDSSVKDSANEVMVHELKQLEADIVELFEVTSKIEPTLFSEAAQNGDVLTLNQIFKEMETSSYLENETLYTKIYSAIKDIQTAVADFNYRLAGSKSALIRMSNGFEWEETLQRLDKAINH